MPLLTVTELRSRAHVPLAKSARGLLSEQARAFDAHGYDVFLSHRYIDGDAILGVKETLVKSGYSVYIDWVEDPQLDRAHVTRATADLLRARMRSCRSLFFAVSSTTESSAWMPWELGYVDGKNGKVAVVPVVNTIQYSFHGQEYLELYPFVDEYEGALWVNNVPNTPHGVQKLTSWLPLT